MSPPSPFQTQQGRYDDSTRGEGGLGPRTPRAWRRRRPGAGAGGPEARPHWAPSWAPERFRAAGRAGRGRGVSSCRRHWVRGGGQTYKPTTRGTPGGGPPGCLRHSADTTMPPKAAKTSGGTGQAPARPTSATEGGWGRCRGGWGRISWGREWGAPRERRCLWHPPHGWPRCLTLSLGWTLEGKEWTPSSPQRPEGRPVLTQPWGHPRTPPGRQAWGSSHNADPRLLLRGR